MMNHHDELQLDLQSFTYFRENNQIKKRKPPITQLARNKKKKKILVPKVIQFVIIPACRTKYLNDFIIFEFLAC